jgi:hypothetical protein
VVSSDQSARAGLRLRAQFSPTLNAHINKIGKFDIDPNRGSLTFSPLSGVERDTGLISGVVC